MSLYRVAVNYSFDGQSMANILYYRDQFVAPVGLDALTAQQGAAEAVKANVVLGGVVGETRLANILPTAVLLENVTAWRLNANTHLPELSGPSIANINLAALAAGAPGAPAICAIMRLTCPAVTITPTDYTPGAGYLALGPLLNGWIGSDGAIAGGALDSFEGFGASLIETLPIGGGFNIVPIRVGRGRNQVNQVVLGFNDVSGAAVKPLWSFRRSRIPG